jgi:tetratricopeptide (TPR) repeat protein
MKKALAIHPYDSKSLEAVAESHIALGNIYYLQQDFSKAQACFEKSQQIDPAWDFSLQVSACCYVLMGNREALKSLLKDHPELIDGYLFTHLYEAIHHGKQIDADELPKTRDVYFPWSLWTLIQSVFDKRRTGVACGKNN